MYIIDGIFFTKRLTGVERFAINIVKELDRLTEKGELKLVVPLHCEPAVSFDNIEIVKYGKRKGYIWEQTDLVSYLKKEKAEGLFLENNIPVLYRRGIIELHDISLKVNPHLSCDSLYHIISLVYWRMIYRLIAGSDMKIITPSEFSKSEIIRVYKIPAERIAVSYEGWQHMNDIEEDTGIVGRMGLKEKGYYFSMSSLALNKNIKWIMEAARQHPNETFVVAGNSAAALGNRVIPGNVILPGYISDGEAKALMRSCKAFVFPSFYEGFGLPPMEALAAGAGAVILSDIGSLREIYGDIASYIDPYRYDDIKLEVPVRLNNETDDFLRRYSWKDSAGILLSVIRGL